MPPRRPWFLIASKRHSACSVCCQTVTAYIFFSPAGNNCATTVCGDNEVFNRQRAKPIDKQEKPHRESKEQQEYCAKT
jgi:hypothetical protein